MKREIISFEDTLYRNSVCDISESKENERFSRILEKLKQYDIIKSFKEFADSINETSVGLNDIKKGRKKLSINHIRDINIKYPFINTDFILFEEGLPFHEDFLIAYCVEGKDYFRFYDFDMEAIENYDYKSNEEVVKASTPSKKDLPISQHNEKDLVSELISTKNELLAAKDKIIELQTELYELRQKMPK